MHLHFELSWAPYNNSILTIGRAPSMAATSRGANPSSLTLHTHTKKHWSAKYYLPMHYNTWILWLTVNPKLIPKVQQAICMTYMSNNRVRIICVKATMIMTKLMTTIMEAAINKEEEEACLPIDVYILWFQNISNFISFFTNNCINKRCKWKNRHK